MYLLNMSTVAERIASMTTLSKNDNFINACHVKVYKFFYKNMLFLLHTLHPKNQSIKTKDFHICLL